MSPFLLQTAPARSGWCCGSNDPVRADIRTVEEILLQRPPLRMSLDSLTQRAMVFLLHYLNSPVAIELMLRSRVVTAQPNISLTDAREFPIPFPPIAEQYRIVAKVDQ
jgi:hypothetical protein